MRVALKVDVDSEYAAIEGVPRLLELFKEYQLKASFYFSVGPDKSGRSKTQWQRISHQGWKPLLNGFIRTPLISIVAKDVMKAVADAGHDIGLKSYDSREWTKKSVFADDKWTSHQLAMGLTAFESVFGTPASTHAASGFQVNSHLLSYQEINKMIFACDTRGKVPYYPELQGVRSKCVQIPVTLSTFMEALSSPSVDLKNIHEHLYAESLYIQPAGHVYSIDAGIEGALYIDIMEKLIVMWKGQEGQLRSVGDLYNELDLSTLPTHQIGWKKHPGNSQHLATQSTEVK